MDGMKKGTYAWNSHMRSEEGALGTTTCKRESLLFYYVQCWKKFATFSGRARRSEYWSFALLNSLLVVVMFFLPPSLDGKVDRSLLIVISWLFIAYVLVASLPGIAVAFRRLHDIGRSGWWLLISLLPYVGAIVLFVLFCLDSQPGKNQYGRNPKLDTRKGDLT